MKLNEAKQILKKAGYLMEAGRDTRFKRNVVNFDELDDDSDVETDEMSDEVNDTSLELCHHIIDTMIDKYKMELNNDYDLYNKLDPRSLPDVRDILSGEKMPEEVVFTRDWSGYADDGRHHTYTLMVKYIKNKFILSFHQDLYSFKARLINLKELNITSSKKDEIVFAINDYENLFKTIEKAIKNIYNYK